MKKLLTLAALVAATSVSFGQGVINWQNSAATLISAGGVATAATAGLYNYAVFFAPSGTASADFQPATGTLGLTDPAFQTASVYNVNAAAAGRVATKNGAAVTGAPGSVADFVIRGWSVNAGATWAEALAFWNNGAPAANMYIGTSLIGNDYVIGGGAIPVANIMGVAGNSAGGFNLTLVPAVPEPSSMVLAGLGAASLLLFRRRK